ncbi:hemin uptake protein HemP [Curvibacter sp. APW13]|uniref:hemin uptake protein HemP n=1 Tax=Curvibacter sp. APW13 TaxID=3077236 RepID=UPI0028DE57F3|nr:hemin uptake protein HemP [Curvibacter sp. APW13]MDT8992107.1 hemin uptake protein HemP [Curvibacter sp. APW13]
MNAGPTQAPERALLVVTEPTAPTQAVIPSETLLRGQTAVVIEHQGQHYRLQATRQGKLILTK